MITSEAKTVVRAELVLCSCTLKCAGVSYCTVIKAVLKVGARHQTLPFQTAQWTHRLQQECLQSTLLSLALVAAQYNFPRGYDLQVMLLLST